MNLKILALVAALLATVTVASIACSSDPEVVEKIVEVRSRSHRLHPKSLRG